MMGSQGGAQERLFYSFSLDDHVPKDHLLRGVDRFLDLSELREHLTPLKQRCCPNTPHRKIPRSVYEDARDAARTVCASPVYEQSRKERKKVEMLFAHLKRILKLDRLRLRGLKGARDEFLMAATAQNLRRMTKWLAPKQEIGGAIAV